MNTTPEKKETIHSPRKFGKMNTALLEFLAMGKNGKAVVFATLEGNFLSPKAVENLLSQREDAVRKKYEQRKENITKLKNKAYDEGFEDGKALVRVDIAEFVSNYTVDLCKNSQEFKNAIFAKLIPPQDSS